MSSKLRILNGKSVDKWSIYTISQLEIEGKWLVHITKTKWKKFGKDNLDIQEKGRKQEGQKKIFKLGIRFLVPSVGIGTIEFLWDILLPFQNIRAHSFAFWISFCSDILERRKYFIWFNYITFTLQACCSILRLKFNRTMSIAKYGRDSLHL